MQIWFLPGTTNFTKEKKKKKGTIFAVCMAIFLMAWCVTPSVANETGGAPAGDPHRGAAAYLMPEPEQPLVFAPPGAAPAPSAIYPGDYDIIFVDNWGDKFYLNKVHQNRAVRVYNGYWSSDWANGLIEPVSATFYGPNYCDSTASMSITAVFQGRTGVVNRYNCDLTRARKSSL